VVRSGGAPINPGTQRVAAGLAAAIVPGVKFNLWTRMFRPLAFTPRTPTLNVINKSTLAATWLFVVSEERSSVQALPNCCSSHGMPAPWELFGVPRRRQELQIPVILSIKEGSTSR